MRSTLRNTKSGSFHAAEHIEFVRNIGRNKAFRRAFEKLAPDRIVVDVGTGSGIMAIYAALAGAKQVIAIEKDERMAKIAKANFDRNGLGDRIKLIVGDALEMTRRDIPQIDLLVGELLSTWCVVEPQVPVFRHLIGISRDRIITIPRRVINYAEGVHASFGDNEGLVYIPTTYFEFQELDPKADKFTTRVKASEIVFSREQELDVTIQISLRALQSGAINALRLASITETCNGITFNPKDDTMPNMIVPLSEEIPLVPGQIISLTIAYTYGAGWENFVIRPE
ncbi:MAG: 50S ribosomal protein L11 methyltransferase [Candidatus Micrarchaeota archaeon]